ncbi:hypothetical protein U9M48_041270 [Paspalum notatum var. saurae]|uniref:Uncharacterized protein n=1 Tax=Paspalum notatum var. saurae TaxID=547442 RepID=A0AAQ3XGD2_PASNO
MDKSIMTSEPEVAVNRFGILSWLTHHKVEVVKNHRLALLIRVVVMEQTDLPLIPHARVVGAGSGDATAAFGGTYKRLPQHGRRHRARVHRHAGRVLGAPHPVVPQTADARLAGSTAAAVTIVGDWVGHNPDEYCLYIYCNQCDVVLIQGVMITPNIPCFQYAWAAEAGLGGATEMAADGTGQAAKGLACVTGELAQPP